MKTEDKEEQYTIQCCDFPKEAKFAGAHVTLREDWEEIKEDFMLKGLRAKFSQHHFLKDNLLATGGSILHEDSPWDKYWGYVKGEGKDRLGILLMQVREELRNDS